MIEFKAECGHTVRAKDEDAGGVVRCSYCGRTAAVPDNESTDLSFLFDDIQVGTDESPRKRRGLLRRLAGPKKRRGAREFNPFAVIFRLCYVALLIVIVVVIAQKFVIPMFDPETRSRKFAGKPSDSTQVDGASNANQQPRRNGLVGSRALSGLFVASTPPGATVFCIDESQAPARGRIDRLPTAARFRANGDAARLPDGTYVVEVVFPWNDPRLSDPTLSNYRSYVAFRRSIEKASHAQRKQLTEAFFVPDEASDIFIDETPDQIYIVRQYRPIRVRQGKSPGVRSLFLPRITTGDDRSFLIEPLVTGYLANLKRYAYDETHVRSELTYYGVADADQPFILQALSRIGVIPYMVSDGRVRLFRIDLHEGTFSTRVIREPEQ